MSHMQLDMDNKDVLNNLATNNQQKKPRILPPMCLCLASSWVKMPWFVDSTKWPNCLDGRMLFVHFSKSSRVMSYLGLMTPHLLILPISSMTIFLDLWSSMISNSPMYPLTCISFRNWITSFETGRISTCFFPFLSAFTMVRRQSESTFIFTIGLYKLIFYQYYQIFPSIFFANLFYISLTTSSSTISSSAPHNPKLTTDQASRLQLQPAGNLGRQTSTSSGIVYPDSIQIQSEARGKFRWYWTLRRMVISSSRMSLARNLQLQTYSKSVMLGGQISMYLHDRKRHASKHNCIQFNPPLKPPQAATQASNKPMQCSMVLIFSSRVSLHFAMTHPSNFSLIWNSGCVNLMLLSLQFCCSEASPSRVAGVGSFKLQARFVAL